jgi:hypothetical protein
MNPVLQHSLAVIVIIMADFTVWEAMACGGQQPKALAILLITDICSAGLRI